MVDFFSENEFTLERQQELSDWISSVIESESCTIGDIGFIFCNDEYLLNLNQEFLQHDTLTDIISFDYSLGKQLHGEIYISTERVQENAQTFQVDFLEELHRVIIHGILHLCGYKDGTKEEKYAMRLKENEALARRSFL